MPCSPTCSFLYNYEGGTEGDINNKNEYKTRFYVLRYFLTVQTECSGACVMLASIVAKSAGTHSINKA